MTCYVGYKDHKDHWWICLKESEKPSQNDSESKWIPNWVDPAGCSHSKVHSIAREVAIVSSFATVLPLIFYMTFWTYMVGWWNRCEDDIFGSRIKSSPRLETSKVDHQAVWNLQLHMAGQWKFKSHPMQITMVLGMENWHGKKWLNNFGVVFLLKTCDAYIRNSIHQSRQNWKMRKCCTKGSLVGSKIRCFISKALKTNVNRWVVDSNETKPLNFDNVHCDFPLVSANLRRQVLEEFFLQNHVV